jgi:hypothetical protein
MGCFPEVPRFFFGGFLKDGLDFRLKRTPLPFGSFFEPSHDFVVQIPNKNLCHPSASFPFQRVKLAKC